MPLRYLPLLTLATTALAAQTIDYQRDVRPILSDRCFKCHGPDEGGRKGGLRLDVREDALKPAKSGERAIVPGKPDASELVARLFKADEGDLMPPPETKKPLTEAQKKVLKQWVAEGADYQPHWAYLKPVTPKVPSAQWTVRSAEADQKEHVAVRTNPIDAFIAQELQKAGLHPSPQADAATLARRVALDLTGLPPPPALLEAFVKEPTDAAYERLVDTLLASQSYGERWARRWLDLARYADTNGYEKDRERSIWPYRDWVISALNADMPFDQFTIEQLAGDMLYEARMKVEGGRWKNDPAWFGEVYSSAFIPQPSSALIIATGFHRNTMLNEEGGIDPLEFRFHAMTDRVSTTGTTWLGLTLQCCQCHTHKYDPITHTEYYGLMAFLNNADEPDYDLPNPAVAEQHQAALTKAAAMIATLPDQFEGGRPAAEQAFAQWLSQQQAVAAAWAPLKPASMKTNLPLLTALPDHSILTSGDSAKSDIFELTFHLEQAGVKALRLEALPHESLPAHGPGFCYYEGPKGDFFMGEFQVQANGSPVKVVSATQSYSKNNFGKNEATAMQATDGDPQTGWSCAARYGERHEAVFVFDPPLPAGELKVTMMFGRHYACPLGRFRLSASVDSKLTAQDLPEEIATLLAVSPSNLSDVQRQQLFTHFLLQAPSLSQQAGRINRLHKPADPITTLVMRERPASHPRATFRHHRGEYTQPKEEVKPVTLSVLHPFPHDQPRDRLTFARWLVSPENPLTPRVVMNRQWAAFFGRGIVKTIEDFGYQGELPTHPELLDWLATEFIRQKWSLKAMHKLIVMSATYRQSSAIDDSRFTIDDLKKPKASPSSQIVNHKSRIINPALFASFPRTRLDAEIIRDSILHASGLLTEKVGGPSVYPPQPDSVTEAAYGKFQWKPSTGPDRYRRSLYTFMKRTAPFAMFTTFDAPTGEQCLASRETSNSPMQALTGMNDIIITEAAQALGKLLVTSASSDAARIDLLFQRTLSRQASRDEHALMLRFVNAQRDRLKAKQLDAAAIAGSKDATLDAAAWTLAARTVFNLDEFVTKG